MITTNDDEFCYWDCQNLPNTIIVMFLLLTTFVLTLYVLCIYHKARHLLKQTNLYIALICWGIFNLAKDSFGVIMYFQLGNNTQHMTKISAVYSIFDSIPALILLTLLYIIPVQMYGNIMGIRQAYGYEPTKSQILFYKFLQKYSFARVIGVLPWLVMCFFPLFDKQALPWIMENLTIIKTCVFSFDCGISIVVLFVTYKHLQKSSQFIRIREKQAERSLKRETILLLIASICRFVTDIVFYLIMPSLWPLPSCLNEKKQPDQFSVVYLFAGTYLMHFLPIAVIAKMYQPKYIE